MPVLRFTQAEGAAITPFMAMAFDPRRFTDFLGKVGHNGLIGLEYHAHGDDWAELALPWRHDLTGDGQSGILASGPILTLFDIVMSYAVWLKRGAFAPQATLDLRVDYLRAARPGATVIGRAHCYRLTHSIAFLRGEAHDGDAADPLASVTGTYILNNGETPLKPSASRGEKR